MKTRTGIILLYLFALAWPAGSKDSPEALRRNLDQTTDPKEQIRLMISLGNLYDDNNFDSALFFFHKGYDLALKQEKVSKTALDKEDFSVLMAITLRNLTYVHNLFGDSEGVTKYAGQLIAMGEQKADTLSLIVAWLSLGNITQSEGNFPLASEHYLRGYNFSQASSDSLHLAKAAQNLGIVHFYMGNLSVAATYTHQALEHYSDMGSLLGEASCLLMLGNLLYDQEDLNKAMNYYNEAYLGFEELNHTEGKYNAILNIGAILIEEGRYQEAIDRFEHALRLARQINDQQGVVRCLHNIGMSFSKLNDPRMALQYYQEALVISQANNFRHLEANTLSNMAGVNNDLGQYSRALNQASTSLQLSREIQSLDDQLHAYRNLSRAQEGLGNFRQALEYHKLFKHFNDSLTRIDNRREISRVEAEFQTERMQQEVELKNALLEKQDLELVQQSVSLNRQRLIRNILFIGLTALAIILAYIYASLRRRKKINALIMHQNREIVTQHEEITQQKHIIEEKNLALVSSIRYAQSIQKALLPDESSLHEAFKEHFVIYEPKEIVSGDFYWVSKQNGVTLLALADSTGHGVPGAFMSLLGMSFLNEYVARHKYTSPAQLLDEMRLYIISSLHQQGDHSDQQDGIEMALVAIDHVERSIVYSGARTPVFIASQNGIILNGNPIPPPEGPVHKLKADTMPLSFHRKMKAFTSHTLKLSSGDMVYMMTDGFADQFGTQTRERFSSQRVTKLLEEIFNLPLDQQKERLLETLYAWKQGCEQVDDIAVIGFRI
jgi:serine phosphatase RsbU (regulator of sigma subunit)